MLFIYGKQLCSACKEAKEYLDKSKTKYTYREFDMKNLSRERREDVIAMAMYHYQDEVLPVFVIGNEGFTFEELEVRI